MNEQSRKLLIVEDDPGLLSQLRWCFEGYDVFTAEDRESAIAELRRHEPTVVLQDLGLPPKPDSVEEGFATLGEILKLAPHTKVIVVTGNGDQGNALHAVAQGAYDFYQKPVDTDTLKLLVDRAFNISELESENRRLQYTASDSPLDGIIAASEGMLSVCRMIEKVAPTNVTTFLLGESGTGKELLAKALHRLSPRSEQNFVAINCAAIPENLLESELFGHEKGAFTGAQAQHKGRFEQANDGSLFLDEIGDMPMELQTRLLRVLAEGEFFRVGGKTPVQTNVRIIAATHRDLEALVKQHHFREDLFHRLNVIKLRLPPLRERREDVPLLLKHFMHRFADEMGEPIRQFNPDVLDYLCRLDWNGNVRQLENTCRWFSVMASGARIQMDDLPEELQPGRADDSRGTEPTDLTEWSELLRCWARQEFSDHQQDVLSKATPVFEKVLLECALESSGGRKQEAARLLGWGRNTLTRKLKELF